MAALYRLRGASDDIGVIRTTDEACIPNADDNDDWLDYLAWRARGNVPDPAQ